MLHTITVTLESDRTTEDLTALAQWALTSISEGYMGSPDDWETFTVLERV